MFNFIPKTLIHYLKLASTSPMTPVYDTIVVGMGASGTAAAAALAKAGKKVLALEGQDRIGGRVHTVPFGDGLVELGAEWIHGSENSRTYELAMQNNISIETQHLEFKVFRSDGSTGDAEIVDDLIRYGLNCSDDPKGPPQPLGEYISGKIREYIQEKYPHLANDTDFVTEFLHFMDLVVDNYEASNSWNDVTTASQYQHLDGDQNLSWHKYGYKTLFEILLNTYNNGPGYPNLEIKLNTEVVQILWPQNPSHDVVVTTKDGTTYHSHNVIVTVSLGVLKERYISLFVPALFPKYMRAIEYMSMGVLDKIVMLYDHMWWPENNVLFFIWRGEDRLQVSDSDFWMKYIDAASEPKGVKRTLTLWINGDAAKTGAPFYGFLWRSMDRASVSEGDLWTTKTDGASLPKHANNTMVLWVVGDGAKTVETLPEEVLRPKVMELMRKFLGANMTIPEPVAILRSKWFNNPFTRGSYTYDNLDTPNFPNARVTLGEPLTDWAGTPRVLFAGEATNPIHFSTVHGAVETGEREAKRLLQASKI